MLYVTGPAFLSGEKMQPGYRLPRARRAVEPMLFPLLLICKMYIYAFE
jgi:hypothetical protein